MSINLIVIQFNIRVYEHKNKYINLVLPIVLRNGVFTNLREEFALNTLDPVTDVNKSTVTIFLIFGNIKPQILSFAKVPCIASGRPET